MKELELVESLDKLYHSWTTTGTVPQENESNILKDSYLIIFEQLTNIEKESLNIPELKELSIYPAKQNSKQEYIKCILKTKNYSRNYQFNIF